MTSDVDNRIDAVMKLWDLGDTDGALRELQSILLAEPNHTKAHAVIGRLWCTLNDVVKAQHHLELATQLDPTFAYAWSGLAMLHEEHQNLPLALEYYQKACRLSPTPSRWVLLGDVQSRLGHLTDARESFERALRLQPDHAEALVNLAHAIEDTPHEAVAMFRKALAIDPAERAAMCGLATQLSYNFKEHEEAKQLLERAISLDESDPWPWYLLGDVHHRQSDLGMAVECFLEALKRDPKDNRAVQELAETLEEQGRMADATEWYTRLMKSAVPLSPSAMASIAWSRLKRNDREGAISWARRALQQKPTCHYAQGLLNFIEQSDQRRQKKRMPDL